MESGIDATFRQALYQAVHVGEAAIWSQKHDIPEDLEWAKRDLDMIADRLAGFR